jgi:hypothetical protein
MYDALTLQKFYTCESQHIDPANRQGSGQKQLTGDGPKPTTQPTRPSSHSRNQLHARRQHDLSSSSTQNLLDDRICYDLRVKDCHSRAVDLRAVGCDHCRCCPYRVHTRQFDFWRVEAVVFAAEFGAEAFVEGERGGFGHAVGDHVAVESKSACGSLS